MERRKNSNLHVVREPEDPTDKIIDEIMDELNSEDGMPEKEVREELMKRKKKKQKKMMVGIAIVAAVGVLIYLLINLQTYTKVRISDTYVGESASDNNYVQFSDGVLKYSKDGISYLSQTGKEKWNQSYQIKNPMIDITEKSAAVADKEGNDILVFQEDGLKGEVQQLVCIGLILFIFFRSDILLNFFSFDEGKAVLNYGVQYFQIISFFYIISLVGSIFVGFYRGTGHVNIPVIGTILQISIRVILSYLLVKFMGIGGVALATGIGWIGIVTFQISVFVIKKYYKAEEEGE